MKKILHHANRLWCNHHGQVKFARVEHQLHLYVDDRTHQMVTDQDLLRATIEGCSQSGPNKKKCTKIERIEEGLARELQLANEIPILANLVAITNGVPAGRVTYSELLDQLEGNEARRAKSYDDGHGNITIGVGTLLKDRNGKTYPNKVAGMGLDFDKLVDGTADPLDDEQIDTLRDRDLNSFRTEVKGNVPGFDALDESRQNALIEMAYNRGLPTFLGQNRHMSADDAQHMKNFHAAVKAGDWETAAQEIESDDAWRYYIKGRLDRFAALIRGKVVYGDPADDGSS